MNITYTHKILLTLLLTVFFTPFTNTQANIIDNKTCNYVEKGLYLPFSDINSTFPVLKAMMNGDGCITVANQVDNMFATGFKVFLGVVSLIAVVQVSVAGIQWMVQDAGSNTFGKRTAKQRLTNSIIGLILAFSSWLILNTVNPKILSSSLSFGGGGPLSNSIRLGISQAANVQPVEDEGLNYGGGSGSAGGGAVGTKDATGAIKPNQAPTVFGYRDGNGTVGGEGDNGLGNGSWSDVSGWTYYNGGAHNPTGDPSKYSQGVALPRSTLIQDFGSADAVKYGAYEIFKNGVSIGAFPVVDDSAEKLDMSYGLVKNHFDPNITSSNSWDSTSHNITYKPLPDYWKTHTRPAQPMVRDDFTTSKPPAAEVDRAVQNGNSFQYR